MVFDSLLEALKMSPQGWWPVRTAKYWVHTICWPSAATILPSKAEQKFRHGKRVCHGSPFSSAALMLLDDISGSL